MGAVLRNLRPERGSASLTHGDVASRNRFLNAQDALHTLIENKIIPIINENDAVAADEIKIGDNDNLSALVAVLADADLLVLLTDQPGSSRQIHDVDLVPS